MQGIIDILHSPCLINNPIFDDSRRAMGRISQMPATQNATTTPTFTSPLNIENLSGVIEKFCIADDRSNGDYKESTIIIDARTGMSITETELHPAYRNKVVFKVKPILGVFEICRADTVFHISVLLPNGSIETAEVRYCTSDKSFICRIYDPTVVIPAIIHDENSAEYLRKDGHPTFNPYYIPNYGGFPNTWYGAVYQPPPPTTPAPPANVREEIAKNIVFSNETSIIPAPGRIKRPLHHGRRRRNSSDDDTCLSLSSEVWQGLDDSPARVQEPSSNDSSEICYGADADAIRELFEKKPIVPKPAPMMMSQLPVMHVSDQDALKNIIKMASTSIVSVPTIVNPFENMPTEKLNLPPPPKIEAREDNVDEMKEVEAKHKIISDEAFTRLVDEVSSLGPDFQTLPDGSIICIKDKHESESIDDFVKRIKYQEERLMQKNATKSVVEQMVEGSYYDGIAVSPPDPSVRIPPNFWDRPEISPYRWSDSDMKRQPGETIDEYMQRMERRYAPPHNKFM